MILTDAVELCGIGLHSGRPSMVRIEPLEPHRGLHVLTGNGPVAIERFDRDGSSRCTRLTHPDGSTTLRSAEHLLGALSGLDIFNAAIGLDGDEVPVMDGSAAPFARALVEASRPGAAPRPLILDESIVLEHGGGRLELRPHDTLKIEVRVDFDHPLIGDQQMRFERGDDFMTELAPARTFGFTHELDKLRARGLVAGGSLDNAVIFDDTGVLNPGGLRFDDEVVRHKMLDLLGDLALCGRPLSAHVIAHRPSHALTCLLPHLSRGRTARYRQCANHDHKQSTGR